MLGYFLADGVSSADYGIYLTDANVYGIAERDVTALSVAGRNGDLLFDNKRYKNKQFSYPCIIRQDFNTHFSAFINYLLSRDGYIRVEDSFNPETFVLARYVGETDPKKVATRGTDGVFELTFDRCPQRFLKAGEKALTLSQGATIKSVYPMTARPLVRAYGTGSVIINGVTIQILSADGYTDIDCETQNAYKGSVNCNGNITLTDGRFFTLESGNNIISMSGVSKIDLTPRWWIL